MEFRGDWVRAVAADPECFDDQAIDHFVQATELDPDNPRYLCEYGSLAIRLGEYEKGLHLLRQARAAAPDDMDTLAAYVTGLVDADQADEARRVLRDEAFRHTGNRRFQTRYRTLRFELAHDEQATLAIEEPCLLPFPQATSVHETDDGRIHRHDTAEGHAGPKRNEGARNEWTQQE